MAEKSTTRDYLDWYRALTRHRMQQEAWVDREAMMDRAFARAAETMERLRQEWARQQAAEPVPRDYLDLQRFVPKDGATQASSWVTPERAAFD
jgi:hypothetical protein